IITFSYASKLGRMSLNSFQSFKVFPGISNVNQRCCRRNGGVTGNHHDICVGSENINEGSKERIFNFHRLKLCCQLGATEFELFDNVGYFLKTMNVPMMTTLAVANDKKSCSLKEEYFICI